MSELNNNPVTRVGDFAIFTMNNGIEVAVELSLSSSHNGRFQFKTTNMRFGSLTPDKELLINDALLVKVTSEYFDKFLNFKRCQRTDTRIEKFDWFINARLPLFIQDFSPETKRSVLLYALRTIKLKKDPYGFLMFTIEDIDSSIKKFLTENPVKNERLIS